MTTGPATPPGHSLAIPGLTRWRLILGQAADAVCGGAGTGGRLDSDTLAMDRSLEWLYGQDPELAGRQIMTGDRGGSREGARLTAPEWINEIHRLFPKETIERLERDAIERFALDEIVTNPEVLARARPNQTLLKAVLRTRHLMEPRVLALARTLVRAVIAQLIETLAGELELAFSGVRDRRRPTRLRSANAFDVRRVVRDNLRHYDPDTRKITIERLHFLLRSRRRLGPWQVILLVDQSASMLGSVIHSAVTAACLWGLPGVRVHLVAFDTAVVDLTADVDDPVELLMKVQLGGGTDIQAAVGYAAELIGQPARAIVVIISDFFEGPPESLLVQRVRGLVGQQTLVLGLAALDQEAAPCFNRPLAQRLVEAGAEIGAMTPGELAGWLAGKIRD